MRAVVLFVQPGLSPRQSLAWDATLLGSAGEGGATLRVYDLSGEVLTLGRYHLAPAGERGLYRRHSGGRAMPSGAGFVGVALTLPHRSALVSADPYALAPEQVMNRCVRGILRGLELGGVPALYPGLDVLTVARRIIGWVSFEIDGAGALLFEAILANECDFGVLPLLLDRQDPDGVVTAAMLGPEDVTCLARERAGPLSLEVIADLVRRGYEAAFDLRIEAGAAPERVPFDDDRWLRARAQHPARDRHARTPVRLGTLEAHFGVREGRLTDVVLAGDFIADSAGIATLEGALEGCRAERAAVAAVVDAVVHPPEHFVLGIGPLATIADTIAKGIDA